MPRRRRDARQSTPTNAQRPSPSQSLEPVVMRADWLVPRAHVVLPSGIRLAVGVADTPETRARGLDVPRLARGGGRVVVRVRRGRSPRVLDAEHASAARYRLARRRRAYREDRRGRSALPAATVSAVPAVSARPLRARNGWLGGYALEEVREGDLLTIDIRSAECGLRSRSAESRRMCNSAFRTPHSEFPFALRTPNSELSSCPRCLSSVTAVRASCRTPRRCRC